MLDAFANFGLLSAIPPWMHRQMEKYICLLYKIGNISSNEVPELRWMLFAQKSKEGQQLPPTLGTLIPHTSRAYFMVLVWRSSTEPCPLVPPATDYFWELVDGSLKPVFCTEAPAPEVLLELRKCNYEIRVVAKRTTSSALTCVDVETLVRMCIQIDLWM